LQLDDHHDQEGRLMTFPRGEKFRYGLKEVSHKKKTGNKKGRAGAWGVGGKWKVVEKKKKN